MEEDEEYQDHLEQESPPPALSRRGSRPETKLKQSRKGKHTGGEKSRRTSKGGVEESNISMSMSMQQDTSKEDALEDSFDVEDSYAAPATEKENNNKAKKREVGEKHVAHHHKSLGESGDVSFEVSGSGENVQHQQAIRKKAGEPKKVRWLLVVYIHVHA